MTFFSLVAQMVKNLPAVWETCVLSLIWEDPWRREQQPIPVFLPGESHGQRSQEAYSPWGNKKLDMTATFTHSLTQQYLRFIFPVMYAVVLFIFIAFNYIIVWRCLEFSIFRLIASWVVSNLLLSLRMLHEHAWNMSLYFSVSQALYEPVMNIETNPSI